MLAALLLYGSTVLAQGGLTVQGVVTDSNGEPLIGVSVQEKGTKVGIITDIDGKYLLKNVSSNGTLIFKYLGMQSLSEKVKGRKIVNVSLSEDVKLLDEVVVVGYGTMKKSDLSGSSQGIKNENFSDQFIHSPEQALKGRIAGVKVSGGNGPGSGISIQIRGTNSMLGGTEPLYVVDGFPIEPSTDAAGTSTSSPSQSTINFINPNDIESIEVLKDASATAIYGARGANGVVLIQTKAGREGKTSVTYSSNYGFVRIPKKINVMNAQEYAQYMNQKELNDRYILEEAVKAGYLAAENLTPLSLPYDGVNGPLPETLGEGSNWQDIVYRNGFTTDQNINIVGGTAKLKNAFSLGYTNSNGVVIETGMERYSISNMTDFSLYPGLKLTNRFSISKVNTKGGFTSTGNAFIDRGVVTNALWCQPTYDLKTDPDDDDLSDLNDGSDFNNPYLLATLYVDERQSFMLKNVANLEYNYRDILTFTGTGAYSNNTNNRGQYFPLSSKRGKRSQGEAFVSSNNMEKIMLEGRVNYNQTFNKHSVGLMGAVSYEKLNYKSTANNYTGFATDINTYHDLSAAMNVFPVDDNWWDSKLISYIFRATYNYDNRYLFTGTFRADGSSRGSESHKYGYFPSVAAAWRFTEESFMAKAKDWLTNGKLRLSYGISGTYPNSPYQSLSKLEFVKYPFNNSLNIGSYETIMPNPNLTWESTSQYNIGLDLGLFNNKLSITLDYYYKLTHDLLQMAKMPPTSGYREMLMNLGEVENKGFEFNVTYNPIKTKNTNLSVFINGGINKNKLISLGDRDFITGPKVVNSVVNRFVVGKPLGVFYGLKKIGVFENWDQVRVEDIGIAQRNGAPGEFIFENLHVDYEMDADGNMVPSATQQINEDDFTVIGDPNPDFVFGFGADFKYKNFDFSFLLDGQIGGDVYWVDYNFMTNMWKAGNMLADAMNNSWIAPYQHTVNGHTFGSKDGQTSNVEFPRATNKNTISSTPFQNGASKVVRYRDDHPHSGNIHDATYLRVQNISIGYTIPVVKFFKHVRSVRLGFSVNNLFTFSSYPGYDPELVSSTSPMMRGIDLGAYPSQRSFLGSLQVKF